MAAEGIFHARIRSPTVEPGVISNGVRNLGVGDAEQISPVGRHAGNKEPVVLLWNSSIFCGCAVCSEVFEG